MDEEIMNMDDDAIWNTDDITPQDYYGNDAEEVEVDTPVETNDEVSEDSETKEDTETLEEKNETEETVETFEIAYNGKKENVTKDEIIILAQKGKDYDRVRPVYDFVKSLAENNNSSIDDFIKQTREELKNNSIEELMEEKNCSREVATELYESREKQKDLARAEQEKNEEQERQDKQTKEFQEFTDMYPNVEPNSIPKEVWQAVKNGTPLKFAYMEHQFKELQKENSILKTNNTNKQQEVNVGLPNENKAKDVYITAWDEA